MKAIKIRLVELKGKTREQKKQQSSNECILSIKIKYFNKYNVISNKQVQLFIIVFLIMFLIFCEIYQKMQSQTPLPVSSDQSTNGKQIITPSDGDSDNYSEEVCKFCYQTETQSQERLISPCGCSGSLKHVHKECLKRWLKVEADRKQGPLAEVSFKLRKPDLKCKLCEKDIIFQNDFCLLRQIFAIFHWVSLIYMLKKIKYYTCISILGSLAINYYFLRYFFGKFVSLSVKIKDNSLVSLIILSLILILLELTFIEVKWNSNDLELSVPFLSNR